MTRKKVLWIEDDAFNELAMLATPVYLASDVELDYAVSATEAMDKLRATPYDAIVLDVRIPPGDDSRWIRTYYDAGESKKTARLGVRLLQNILGPNDNWMRTLPAEARERKRYGILSMDADDVRADLEPLGVSYFHNKNEGSRILLDLIREILEGLEKSGHGTR